MSDYSILPLKGILSEEALGKNYSLTTHEKGGHSKYDSVSGIAQNDQYFIQGCNLNELNCNSNISLLGVFLNVSVLPDQWIQ